MSATHVEMSTVAQLQPQMNNVSINVIVLESSQLVRLMSGDNLQTLRVADSTGCINLTIRNPDLFDVFQPGDRLRLKNFFTNIFKGGLTLGCSRMGEITRVGDFLQAYSETPNMSDYNAQYASLERARKGSPPEDGEVGSGPVDPRRHPGARGGGGGYTGHKRPYPGSSEGRPPPNGGGGPPSNNTSSRSHSQAQQRPHNGTPSYQSRGDHATRT